MFNFKRYKNVTEIRIPDNVTLSTTNCSKVFNNMVNLKYCYIGKVPADTIVNMYEMFRNCNRLSTPPISGKNTTLMVSSYSQCTNLTGSPACGDNVVNMYFTYKDCHNLTGSPACGENVTDMCHTYYNCYNLTGSPVCGPKVIDMDNAYSCCFNLTGSPACGENVEDMRSAYYACYNLTGSPACGNKVYTMQETYLDCRNLTGSPVCGNNVVDMDNTYQGCHNLTGSPVCGENVVNMSYTYLNCFNLTGSPVCGDKVTNMCGAYYNCHNLTGSPVCGNNVVDMGSWLEGAYENCYNLTGIPVCGPNVTNMCKTYYGCTNLTGSPVCGENVTNMYFAYDNCHNLTGSPVCGNNVTSMSYTYYGCYNLTGSPVCGNNVIDMGYAYGQCYNLTGSPVCGEKVTNMSGAYYSCKNLLGSPVCGPKVRQMNSTYANCFNLYGNMYIYSSSVSEVGRCFQGRNTLNILNIYVVEGSATNSTFSNSTSSYYSLTNNTISWTTDTVNNCYYNTYENIYIYPVANIEAARTMNGESTKELYYQDAMDKIITLEGPETIELVYIANDSTMVPTFTVEPDNQIVTIDNIIYENNKLRFDINSLATGTVNITINAVINNNSYSQTFVVKIYETIPYTYSVEDVPGASYNFKHIGDEQYESTNQGVGSSYSICKLNFYTNGEHNLYLDCINSGEGNYDFGILSTVDNSLALSNTADTENVLKSFKGSSSTDIQTVDYGIIPEGQHFIYIKFIKDSGGNNGNDSLRFKVRFEQ